MSRLGSVQLGNGQLGTTGNIETITLDSASTSILSNNINATHAVDATAASSSNLSQIINGTFTINKSATTTSTLSNIINGIFTLGLTPTQSRLGDSTLGSGLVGQPSSFEANSTVAFGINAKFSVGLQSASASSLSFQIIRVHLLDFESESITEFDWVLSEDSYEELYGETLGSAEKDTIILGNGEKQIVVLANADID